MDPAPAPAPDAAMTSTQQIIGGDEYIESEEVSHLGENIIDNDAVTAVAGRETDESTSGMASTDAKVEDSSSQTQEDGRRSNVETAAVIRMPSERADDKEKRDSARALRMVRVRLLSSFSSSVCDDSFFLFFYMFLSDATNYYYFYRHITISLTSTIITILISNHHEIKSNKKEEEEEEEKGSKLTNRQYLASFFPFLIGGHRKLSRPKSITYKNN